MGKRKKIKQNNKINNAVILLTLGALAFFIYTSFKSAGGGSRKTPEEALQAFATKFREKKGILFRTDLLAPVPMPETMEELDPSGGWEGLNVFFLNEDMAWLLENANKISLAAALAQNMEIDDWKRKDVWARYVMARVALLNSAPGIVLSAGVSGPANQEGFVDVKVDTGAYQMPVKMKWEGGGYKVAEWFGQKAALEAQFPAIQGLMPAGMN